MLLLIVLFYYLLYLHYYLYILNLEFRIKINQKLFLRNPEESVLGKKIVKNGLIYINKVGFELFTFKKLASEINTTEASIYRYFENKHKLLVYLITWYWSFLEYKVLFGINNIKDPKQKLKSIIKILCEEPLDNKDTTDFISESEIYKLAIWEGSKAYLTRNVVNDNKDRIFKPYKDLCELISNIIVEHNAAYKYPHSLASTIIEMSHSQIFFKENLPSLTDFVNEKDNKKIELFLESLLF